MSYVYPPANTNSYGMSEREQYEYAVRASMASFNEQQAYAHPAYHPPPPAYGNMDSRQYSNHAAHGSQALQNQSATNQDELEGSIYAQAKELYDNPLAHNESWSPTQEDANMHQLPTIDFMLRIKSHFGRRGGSQFDTVPRSFERPVPASALHASPRRFQPIISRGSGKNGFVGEGFKMNFHGQLFALHDISAADVGRFLEDIVVSGKVGAVGQVVANVAPISMHMGLTGYFVTRAIVKGMARRNEPMVMDTIEVWQERFFGPRGLDVFVVKNGERLTAQRVGSNPGLLSPSVASMLVSASQNPTGNRRDSSDSMRDKKHKDKKDHKDRQWGPCLVVMPLIPQ